MNRRGFFAGLALALVARLPFCRRQRNGVLVQEFRSEGLTSVIEMRWRVASAADLDLLDRRGHWVNISRTHVARLVERDGW